MPKQPKIVIPPGHAYCKGCGAVHPHSDFPRNAGGGYRSHCRRYRRVLQMPAWKAQEFAVRKATQKRRAEGEARAAEKLRAHLVVAPPAEGEGT